MYVRKVVPFLLIAGGVMMFVHHKRLEFMGQCEEGEQRRPLGPRGPYGLHGSHGEWSKRVPPLFEKWHNAAHAAESQPGASAPAV